jgi:hypothetical protein
MGRLADSGKMCISQKAHSFSKSIQFESTDSIARMSAEEEEDEEILIEPDDESLTTPLCSSDPVDPFNQAGLERLESAIATYNAFFPFSPATLDSSFQIKLDLTRDFLPLAMQCSYGYLNHPNLLTIAIRLTDFNWAVSPAYLEVRHPIYGTAYIGHGLVATAIAEFFSPRYRPRSRYRVHSRLLVSTGLVNTTHLAQLVSQGCGEAAAARALLACNNDLAEAMAFLRTGTATNDYQPLEIGYGACPLLYLVFEIGEAFLDLSDHCCMCRTEMPAGLKPWVCSKELCIYQHSRLGVGNSVSQEIQRDPMVADLLVSVFGAACAGPYLADIPESLKKMDAKQILGQLPPMEVIAKRVTNDQDLTALIGPAAVQLLRWVLMSNRNHLISLKNPTIPGAKFQFLTLLASPESEMVFESLKKEYGSCLLWHGSATPRWHAIIREGLKNFSHTPGQAHGAVAGPGIYLAQDSSTSLSYSYGFGGSFYTNSQLARQLQILALCEVAQIPANGVTRTIEDVAGRVRRVEVTGHLRAHSRIFTLTMEAACIVRALFVGDLRMDIDSLQHPPRVLTLKEVLDEKANSAI